MSKIKLFCLPYAGGSASIYNLWYKYLKPDIELIPVELSGRGRRINESGYETLDDAVDDAFNLIRHHILGTEYAMFGHSMGSLISYKLAHKIRKHRLPKANHIFFSGRGAPHVPKSDPRLFHLMDDA